MGEHKRTRPQEGPRQADTKAPPAVVAAHSGATRPVPKRTSSRRPSASAGNSVPATCMKSVCRKAAGHAVRSRRSGVATLGWPHARGPAACSSDAC